MFDIEQNHIRARDGARCAFLQTNVRYKSCKIKKNGKEYISPIIYVIYMFRIVKKLTIKTVAN